MNTKVQVNIMINVRVKAYAATRLVSLVNQQRGIATDIALDERRKGKKGSSVLSKGKLRHDGRA